MTAEIVKVTLYEKDNFVIFDDCDSQTDYFHNYILNQKETAEWINEKGADCIRIDVSNNDSSIPALRRVKQICKKCGYTYEDKSYMYRYPGLDLTVYILEYELKRITPSLFKVRWWAPAAGKYLESEPMDEESADKLVLDLRAHGRNSTEKRRQPPSL